MHGEHRHLRAHADAGRGRGRPAAVAPNGTMLDLTGDRPRIIDQIETARVYLDGKVQIGQFDGVVRDRLRTAINGHVVVTLILEEDDEPLGDPWCELIGLPEQRHLEGAAGRGPGGGSGAARSAAPTRKTMRDDDALEDALRAAFARSAATRSARSPK